MLHILTKEALIIPRTIKELWLLLSHMLLVPYKEQDGYADKSLLVSNLTPLIPLFFFRPRCGRHPLIGWH